MPQDIIAAMNSEKIRREKRRRDRRKSEQANSEEILDTSNQDSIDEDVRLLSMENSMKLRKLTFKLKKARTTHSVK